MSCPIHIRRRNCIWTSSWNSCYYFWEFGDELLFELCLLVRIEQRVFGLWKTHFSVSGTVKESRKTEKRPSLTLWGTHHLGSRIQYTWVSHWHSVGPLKIRRFHKSQSSASLTQSMEWECSGERFFSATGWRCICLLREHMKVWTQNTSFRATAALAPTSSCVNAKRRRVRDKTLK